MEFLIAIAFLGLYVAGAFISSSTLTKDLIKEKKFHLLMNDGEARIIAGPRYQPLQVSDAEAHLSVVKQMAESTRALWPLTLFRLYGPNKGTASQTDIEMVRKHAVESQRQDLLVKAINKGYENDPIIPVIMAAQTDESFKILREKINAGSPGVAIEIGSEEAKIKTMDRTQKSEIVLLSSKKPMAPVNWHSSPSNVQAVRSKPTEKGIQLPEGFSWEMDWSRKGTDLEEMVVTVVDKNGRKIRSESFYTSIWGTAEKQKAKIRELQKILAMSAHHETQEGKIDKSLLS